MQRFGFFVTQLVRFGWAETKACAFAGALLAGLAISTVLPLPIARYDALLLYAVALTVTFGVLKLESRRDLLLICCFHLIGLAFELAKVNLGSWSYPEEAVFMIAGVPLYSGFMYAAVGSYVCRAWRILDLRVEGYRAVPMVCIAVAVYANFLTHYWIPDLRIPIALALVLVSWRSTVRFRVGVVDYRMPLPVSFVLIGFFLWVAENVATYFGAWRYPYQDPTWVPVDIAKFGSWALLVTVSFVLIAAHRRLDGSRPTPFGAMSSTLKRDTP